MNIVLLLLVGLAAGILSGLLGIGGGILIIPSLVFLFGLSQQAAQGTTLALMVPPIGLLAAWTYYKQGYVDLKMAGLICAGFFIGGLLGARDRRPARSDPAQATLRRPPAGHVRQDDMGAISSCSAACAPVPAIIDAQGHSHYDTPQ